MADPAVEKISIPGPTLSMIMQRFTTSAADCDGLLFGHLRSLSAPNLADDDTETASREELVATVTGFTTSAAPQSFYDPVGRLHNANFAALSAAAAGNHDPLIGWFVARRNTPLRPSMREAGVTSSLRNSNSGAENRVESPNVAVEDGCFLGRRGSKSALGLPYSESSSVSPSGRSPRREKTPPVKEKPQVAKASGIPPLSPCIFLIFSESFAQYSIHTHEYRAYQYRGGVFESKSLSIVNIGPGFRSLYSAFSPVSCFPMLPSGFESLSEESGDTREDMNWQKSRQGTGEKSGFEVAGEKGVLDFHSVGFPVDRLSQLIRSDATHVVSEVEDLYRGMITKLEHLATQVAESSQALSEQEKHNTKLRCKLAGME